MARAVPLWRGKTDDAKVPPRVRARIFEREGGKCWLSGRKIAAGEPWQLDHKVALINGGSHSEDNLAPALKDKHREKTKADVAEKAKVAKKRQAHLGIKSPGQKIQSRGFEKAKPQRRASSPLKKWNPWRLDSPQGRGED